MLASVFEGDFEAEVGESEFADLADLDCEIDSEAAVLKQFVVAAVLEASVVVQIEPTPLVSPTVSSISTNIYLQFQDHQKKGKTINANSKKILLCFHQLCCCSSTCIHQERCVLSNYISRYLQLMT